MSIAYVVAGYVGTCDHRIPEHSSATALDSTLVRSRKLDFDNPSAGIRSLLSGNAFDILASG
jgi:hypothetical protein